MVKAPEPVVTSPADGTSPAVGSGAPAPRARGARLLGWARGGGFVWPLLALAVLLALDGAFSPGFFHFTVRDGRIYGSLIDILNRASPLVLVTMGMTLVIATGGVDLSVGAVMAISGAVAAALIARPDFSPLGGINVHGSLFLVITLSMALSLAAGIWNGVLVAAIDIQPIVATLILMVAGRGIAQLLTGGQIITFSDARFSSLGNGAFLGLPAPVPIALAAVLLTAFLTRATALSLFIESVGSNPTAARYAGVNERLVKLVAYAFCGLCAGLAGLLETADIHAADANNAGLYKELDAILAVCVGGTALTGGRFSLLGSLIGALLIQTLTTTILTRGIPWPTTLVVKAAVIIAVCLLQSEVFRSKLGRMFAGRRA